MPKIDDVTPPPLTISRVFPVDRKTVFQAWSGADHIRRWFSPKHYTVPDAEIEFRAGGVFAVCMRSPDGHDIWTRGTFTEVSSPDRLAFTASVARGGAPGFTVETIVLFETVAAGTRMSVRQQYIIHDPAFLAAVTGAPEGWRTTLDKLERALTGGSAVHDTFTVERVYNVPPEIVFHALTDQAAKDRWFNGDFTTLERIMDVRPGGRERLKARWANGKAHTFDAVYFDVVPNARLVYAYEMHLDDRKISVSLATMLLTPADLSLIHI